LSVRGEVVGFAGALHLDDANAVPDEIEEAPVLRVLETRDLETPRAEAGKEVVQEGLSLRALRSGVDAPARGELRQPLPDLLDRQRHGTAVRLRAAVRAQALRRTSAASSGDARRQAAHAPPEPRRPGADPLRRARSARSRVVRALARPRRTG